METVYELSHGYFERARPVLGAPPADLAYIDSALTGQSPARLFVDDAERPTSALLARTYEYFAGGATGTALDGFIADRPAEVGIWPDFYGFVAVDMSWIGHLEMLIPELERIGRRSFRFDPARVDLVRGWQDRVPEDATIVPLPRELAEQADREMPEMIERFWSGYEGFVEHGFGAVALIDGHPVSITYAVGVGAEEANCGVLTIESQRRRGLASLCSQAFIEMALERGLVPTWDCDEENAASAALAQALGFIEHEPFVELGMPERQPPKMSTGLWRPESRSDGLTAWVRV